MEDKLREAIHQILYLLRLEQPDCFTIISWTGTKTVGFIYLERSCIFTLEGLEEALKDSGLDKTVMVFAEFLYKHLELDR